MAKPELGTKRLCAHCGAKFYDLNHTPITCPKCGAVFEAVQVASRGGRGEAARAPVREVETGGAGDPGGRIRLPGRGRCRGAGQEEDRGEPVEGEEDVELDDDESLDDAAFIEETEEEDTDVTEIIGGDIENEEET